MTPQQLLQGIKTKNLRALSRLITLAENQDDTAMPIFSDLYKNLGSAQVLGLTGPPGAGKSTLTNSFVKFLREEKKTVAVVAVDPVSPFSGGALLGDRIRLSDHFNDPGVFIRSLSTRGKLGGLSLATREVVHALSAFGFDHILVETVGVGQSEVDIRRLADVTLVVLVPESGDSIQTLKAGLLEIGDIFVVNKSDREGAEKLLSELKALCQMAGHPTTPLLCASQKDENSLRQLLGSIEKYFASNERLILERRKDFSLETATELLQRIVTKEAENWVKRHARKENNPYEFVLNFRKSHPPENLFSS